MKEIIEGLNLPKQVLDKTDKFLSALFGPAIKEFGELFADKVRSKRLNNQIKIFNDTIKILEKNGLETRQLNLKTLIPLIEKSSLEDDEKLQDKWANLIANIASTPETGLEPKLINTLSNLSSLEASILDYISEEFEYKRKRIYDRSIETKRSRFKNIDDVKPDLVQITFKSVKEKFNLNDEFTTIYIDNLEALGLIRYEDPEIEIDNGFPEAALEEDKQGQKINVEIDVSANYIKSEDFNITSYGKYFINQCKI